MAVCLGITRKNNERLILDCCVYFPLFSSLSQIAITLSIRFISLYFQIPFWVFTLFQLLQKQHSTQVATHLVSLSELSSIESSYMNFEDYVEVHLTFILLFSLNFLFIELFSKSKPNSKMGMAMFFGKNITVVVLLAFVLFNRVPWSLVAQLALVLVLNFVRY